MQLILTALFSAVISLGGMFLAYNYVPLDAVSVNVPQNLGSTITTILGTDTLSSSRAVINTNFSNLNTDKLQSGDTASSLTITTGTIGTLTLTNALGVANGGTASTSISLNSVILGNGTSGFKTVTGHGVSGQFLTSGGAGAAPTWTTSALDLTLNYNWTGTNLFKNLNASSTSANPIVLNGLSFNTQATRQASSTVLTEDGSGNLRFITPQSYVLGANSRLLFTTSSTATSSGATVRIPANTLSDVASLDVQATVSAVSNSTYCAWDIGLGNGSATSSIGQWRQAGNATQYGLSEISVMATSTNSIFAVNRYNVSAWPAEAGATVNTLQQIYNVSADTTGTLYLSFGAVSGSGNTCGILGYSVRVNRQ